MPIQQDDIELVESDTMDDTAQGGGAMTANVIIDGDSNNIFEDISTLDRVYGAVHMRKVYPKINIQTQDVYFGSHVIISKLPGDQKIGVNLFNTKDWFDRRPEAQSRVENYRAKGANYIGFLWATQWKDSKVISIFQSESAPIPGIGDVLYLTQTSDSETQYIKIVSLDEEVQTFTDASGTFKRRILSITISQNLEYDFVGAQISRLDTLTPATTIKNTVVANAAKYFSARPLALPGVDTELTLKVDGVYSQVIPSSLQELAITDADLNGIAAPLFDSAQATTTASISTTFAANTSFYLGSPCLPGTLSIPVSGGTIIDDGGNMKVGETVVGTINYIEGSISFTSTSPSYSGTKTVTFRPAAAPVKVADTAILDVTAANRGFVWVHNIAPTPLPGSVQVSFRALGEWYTLYDNGTGGLFGQDSGIGSGTINYSTGSLSVTFSALPDADSAILIAWGKDARYFNRSNIAPDPMKVKYQLSQTGIARGTLTIAWNDGTARTATADNSGVITGDATGTVKHTTGELEFFPNTLPLGGTQFTVDYQWGTPLEKTFTAPVPSSGILTLTLDDTNLIENSIEVKWNAKIDQTTYQDLYYLSRTTMMRQVTAKDDGLGVLKLSDGTTVTSSSVNYATGVIAFNPDTTIPINNPVYSLVQSGVFRQHYLATR